MKEKKKKNKWQSKIFILLILSLPAIGYWNSLKETKALENSKVTIGTITEIQKQNRRGFLVQYEFVVNGKTYTDNQKLTIKKESIAIGDRFEIKYSEINPDYNKLDFQKRVLE